MPTNVVKTAEQERLWSKAKKRAAAEGRTKDFAYIMGIFKRMGGLSKSLVKSTVTSRWEHSDAAEYAEKLRRKYGPPDIEQSDLISWETVPGFRYVYVVDESVPHSFPAPHRDFVYATRVIDNTTPEHVAAFAKVTESIMFDRLKDEVTARCGHLDANAVSLGFVEEVVAGKARPTRAEYGRRIKGLVFPSWYKPPFRKSLSIDLDRDPSELRKATTGGGQPVHTTQVQPSWMRQPGAASFLRQRFERNPERAYLNDLYTGRRMPRPKILISEGGPYFNGNDVVQGLGLSSAEETMWAMRIDDWVGRARDELKLRTSLFANLRDYPEIDPMLRTELARRALALYREKRHQAGDFMVKSNPPLLVGLRKAYGGRQSTRGTQVKDRNPAGVGRRPGRTVSAANPPGKGSPAAANNGMEERPKAPPTPTEGRDTGIQDDDDEPAQNGLDTADLAGGPQDEQHIQKKLESLVDELHALHEHMDDDDDHLVDMHNAIKDKMRDAYNDADPEGLREVQHLIHHFHEIVLGAPEEEPDEEEMGPNGKPMPGKPPMGNGKPPPNGKPPMGKGPPGNMRKGGIYFDFL